MKAIVAWGLDVPVVVVDGTVGTAELREQGIIGDVVVAAFNRPAGAGELDFTFFRQALSFGDDGSTGGRRGQTTAGEQRGSDTTMKHEGTRDVALTALEVMSATQQPSG